MISDSTTPVKDWHYYENRRIERAKQAKEREMRSEQAQRELTNRNKRDAKVFIPLGLICMALCFISPLAALMCAGLIVLVAKMLAKQDVT